MVILRRCKRGLTAAGRILVLPPTVPFLLRSVMPKSSTCSLSYVKILHVAPGLGDGGAEAILFRLVSGLPHLEHRVICLGPSGKYEHLLKKIGVEVIVLELTLNWSGVRRLLLARRMVKNYRPRVVQGWLYHGNLVASLLALGSRTTKVFWSLHHTKLVKGVDPWHTLLAAKLGVLLSYLSPKTIVCVAQASRTEHRKSGYYPLKLKVFPNGHDVALYRPDDAARNNFRSAVGIPPGVFVFGTVARDAPQKDLPNLLNGISLLSASRDDFVCFLFGEGMTDENTALVSLIGDFGVGSVVRLMGPQASMHEIYPGLDSHVTSSAFGEALPNAICEAMACGVPCITTDVGDSGEIVGRTGLIVPPSDPVALREAMELMIQLSDVGEQWLARKKQCRSRIAKDYGLEKMLGAYFGLWGGGETHT